MILASNGIDWPKFQCNFIIRIVYKIELKFKILRNYAFRVLEKSHMTNSSRRFIKKIKTLSICT